MCSDPPTIEIPLDEKKRVDLVNGKPTKVDRFSIGELTGIKMAMEQLSLTSSGVFRGFVMHDKVKIECVGVQPAENGRNPRPDFKITVDR